MKDYKKIYQEWLENPYFDEETKKELRALEGNEKEIEERFYKDLEFGTAGLRGVIGAGINRMNIYTVRRATQGLANYIIKQGGAAKGVAIAFDSRHMSPEFAMEAAMTLAANGIKMKEVARIGVFAHGLAGDLLAGRVGMRGISSGLLAEEMGAAWSEIEG